MKTQRRASRRQFLKASVAAIGGGSVAATTGFADDKPETAAVQGKLKRDPVQNATVEKNRSFITEAPRRTRVAADVDALVVGGGPAVCGRGEVRRVRRIA